MLEMTFLAKVNPGTRRASSFSKEVSRIRICLVRLLSAETIEDLEWVSRSNVDMFHFIFLAKEGSVELAIACTIIKLEMLIEGVPKYLLGRRILDKSAIDWWQSEHSKWANSGRRSPDLTFVSSDSERFKLEIICPFAQA